MNRQEHIRQVLAVARSHEVISRQISSANFECLDRAADFRGNPELRLQNLGRVLIRRGCGMLP
jgi:hypothetical protein